MQTFNFNFLIDGRPQRTSYTGYFLEDGAEFDGTVVFIQKRRFAVISQSGPDIKRMNGKKLLTDAEYEAVMAEINAAEDDVFAANESNFIKLRAEFNERRLSLLQSLSGQLGIAQSDLAIILDVSI